MAKLKVSDLDSIKEKVKRTTTLRDGEGNARVIVHMGTCGIAAGARAVMTALLDEIEQKKATEVLVTTAGCAGLCSREPMATVEIAGQAPVKYVDLTEDKVRRVLNDHVIGGQVVSEYALAIGSEQMH